MRSERTCPAYVWWIVAFAGILGLLLAVDAMAVFMFLLLARAASGAPPNPYIGVLAFLVVPAAVLIGLVGSWGAYQFCRDHPAAKRKAAAVLPR